MEAEPAAAEEASSSPSKSQNADGWSSAQQRGEYRKALLTPLRRPDIWEPIPVSWILTWMQYLDGGSDCTTENVESLYPGPIDASALESDFEGELRRDIEENKDYILLPRQFSDKLFLHYGGEKRFPRRVCEDASGLKRVNLYPIRFEVSICGRGSAFPEEGSIPKIYYCPEYETVGEAFRGFAGNYRAYDNIRNNFKSVRFWTKLRTKTEEAEAVVVESTESTVTTTDSLPPDYNSATVTPSEHQSVLLSPSSSTSTLASDSEVGTPPSIMLKIPDPLPPLSSLRFVTVDTVNTVEDSSGTWYLHKLPWSDAPLQSILSDRNCVELLIEGCELGNPTWNSWPRSSLMGSWLSNLRRGDVIDVEKMDEDSEESKWVDATVLSVRQNEDLCKVHYRTRPREEDEEIPIVSSRLAPLYSCSENWRSALAKTAEVDICLPITPDEWFGPGETLWVPGRVEKVDNDKIYICYNEGVIDDERAKRQRAKRNKDISIFDAIVEAFTSSLNSRSTSSKPSVRLNKAWFSSSSEEIARGGTFTTSKMPLIKESHSESSSRWRASGLDYSDRSRKGYPAARGAVGLANLGNTCYMNSMVQCLSHIELLTKLFVDGRYKSQLNTTNRTGFKGELAKAYAKLLSDIYSNSFVIVSPNEFKSQIGRCWSQFSRYDQQDSQELMGYLIDGLHEDLNKIAVKPYVPTVDSDGHSDDLLSRESWRRHLLRHDSEINDIMYGQSKSKVTCNNCGKISVVFEPFFCLSLPIPVKSKKSINVIVRLQSMNTPFEICVEHDARDPTSKLLSTCIARLEQLSLLKNEENVDDRVINSAWEFFETTSGFATFDLLTGNERVSFSLYSRYYLIQEEAKDSKDNNDDGQFSSENCLFFIGEKHGSSAFINLTDLPSPLSFRSSLKNSELYEIAKSFCQRYLTEKFDLSEEFTFTLYVCSTRNQQLISQIPCDDSLSKIPARHSIAIVWKEGFKSFNKSMKTFELKGGSPAEMARRLALKDCLDKFIEEEVLPETEAYYCSGCKQHLAPKKKLDIWASPDVLAIHLKRFSYNSGNYGVYRSKITEFVDFPLDGLDLSPYIKGIVDPNAPPIYDLCSVSYHSGSLGGGHYTAGCRNNTTGQWYYFNDSSVTPLSPANVVSEQAYVLVYKRRTGRLRWGGIIPTSGDEIIADPPSK